MTENCAAGIDVVSEDDFRLLHGQRIGLITNHTGLDCSGRSTVDLFRRAPDVDLRVLFGPEHGVHGDVDAHVADEHDGRLGIPIYSLYGARMRPHPDQLEGLDTLVYDIQDVGCRFYTYSSTLCLCMEAANEAGLKVVVLDRPNPIGGDMIEGPRADADRLDFVAYHTIPVRHGLTLGELALLFRAERTPGLELEVIPARGWRRASMWDETGLTWINPSPNMRSLTQALLYPGIGLLEFTNISVGRGTDTPFEVLGAPWIDQRSLAGYLNDAGLPGVRFVPILFTPRERQHAGVLCGGINIVIVERDKLMPVLVGITIAVTLLRLYPTQWESHLLDRLLVNRTSFAALAAGAQALTVYESWTDELNEFRRRREPFLLYA